MFPDPSFWPIYFWTLAGVAISVVLPLIRKNLPRPLVQESRWSRLSRVMKPYVALFCFSALAALLVVAFMQDQLTDWKAALLAGYVADSTLQKIEIPVLTP